MSDLQLIRPVGKEWPTTQTYQEHIERAKANGWCWKPGVCPYLTGVTFPPIKPPTSKMVRALQSVNCRTEPAVSAANTIGLLKAGKIIECTGEAVEAEGRKWSKCIVYIASEFLEPV